MNSLHEDNNILDLLKLFFNGNKGCQITLTP